MIVLSYINKIAQLEYEQRSQEVDEYIRFKEHKACDDQPSRRRFNMGKTIQLLSSWIAMKFF